MCAMGSGVRPLPRLVVDEDRTIANIRTLTEKGAYSSVTHELAVNGRLCRLSATVGQRWCREK